MRKIGPYSLNRVCRGYVPTCLGDIPDNSVHCVITSPPYWGLREYEGVEPQKWGDGWEGVLGGEPSPEKFIAHIVEIGREIWRILRSDGTFWLNLGDNYVRNPKKGVKFEGENTSLTNRAAEQGIRGHPIPDGMKQGDLCMIPPMTALALRADGWWLRQEIVWHKPNPMTEPVKSRCTRAHEMIYMLTKAERYFYDNEAIKEPSVTKKDQDRNKRSVWRIPTSGIREEHYASFPEALVEPMVLAGTSAKGCCSACGAPWIRVVKRENTERDDAGRTHSTAGQRIGKAPSPERGWETKTTTIGWEPTCSCGQEDVVPAIVCDPFAGTGTTLAVALKHGRHAVGFDASPKYVGLADIRVREGITGLTKTEQEAGQGFLFD